MSLAGSLLLAGCVPATPTTHPATPPPPSAAQPEAVGPNTLHVLCEQGAQRPGSIVTVAGMARITPSESGPPWVAFVGSELEHVVVYGRLSTRQPLPIPDPVPSYRTARGRCLGLDDQQRVLLQDVVLLTDDR